jgi:hypothetical protein
MTYSEVKITATDNGWIVETNYFCSGLAQKKVFLKFSDVLNFIKSSMRVTK